MSIFRFKINGLTPTDKGSCETHMKKFVYLTLRLYTFSIRGIVFSISSSVSIFDK